MIPTKPPPSLKETDQTNWSLSFRDFVNKCLVKNPEERQTATGLLQHDFISASRPPTILMELVSHTMQAREEELSDSDSDVSNGQPDYKLIWLTIKTTGIRFG